MLFKVKLEVNVLLHVHLEVETRPAGGVRVEFQSVDRGARRAPDRDAYVNALSVMSK